MGGGGDFGSGSGSKFNCAARVGSGRVRRSRVRAGFGLQFWARADLYNTIGQDIQTLTYHSSTSNMAFHLKDVCSSNFTWPLNMMLT